MSLPLRPPLFVHHMGALDGHDYPPNSLEAIRASLEHGAAVIEIDITALADGDYLLVHDPVLESETTGAGAVADCTVEQARTLYCAVGGKATPYRVPTLRDVVALFLEYGGTTRLQLDFKNVIPFTNDAPLRCLVRLIEPLGDRVIVSSEADWQLRRLRQLAPSLDLGFDIKFYLDWLTTREREEERLPHRLGAYGYYDDHPLAIQRVWSTADYLAERCHTLVNLVPGISTIYIRHGMIARSLDDGFNWASALHDAGIKLGAWTLDVGNPIAEANVKRLLDARVDQFTSNTPVALQAFLEA